MSSFGEYIDSRKGRFFIKPYVKKFGNYFHLLYLEYTGCGVCLHIKAVFCSIEENRQCFIHSFYRTYIAIKNTQHFIFTKKLITGTVACTSFDFYNKSTTLLAGYYFLLLSCSIYPYLLSCMLMLSCHGQYNTSRH